MERTNKQVKKTIEFYDANAADYADQIESLAPIIEIEKFIRFLPAGGEVLDVGCAAGRDSRELQKRGLEVIGIDVSAGLLAEAKRRSPNITFEKMDMRKLKFPKESFDGIYATASLLHLPTVRDVEKTLTEFERVLKTNGILHIKVKRREEEENPTEIIKGKLSRRNPIFFRYFSEIELENLVKEAGFTIEEIYTYNAQDRNPNSRPLDWISLFATR